MRTAGVWRENPARNRIWLACSCGVIALQVRARMAICVPVCARAWRYAFPYARVHVDMRSRMRGSMRLWDVSNAAARGDMRSFAFFCAARILVAFSPHARFRVQLVHSHFVTLDTGADAWVSGVPPLAWALVFAFPFAAIAVDEVVKRHDKARFEFQMTRLRIHFDTRLGQYSPQ